MGERNPLEEVPEAESSQAQYEAQALNLRSVCVCTKDAGSELVRIDQV